MILLAVDTSLTSVSACVFDGAANEMIAEECLLMERGHAEALMPLIERMALRIEGGLSGVDRIAVTVGPGSFTGIRVGVSAARAMGLALEIPVVGVSTLAAFAAELVMDEGEGSIVAAIDARHGQVYFQSWTASGKPLLKPQVASAIDAAQLIGDGPFRVTGTGAANLAIEAWALGKTVDVAGEFHNPLIEYVARLGMSADPGLAPSLPLYIKSADVTPALA